MARWLKRVPTAQMPWRAVVARQSFTYEEPGDPTVYGATIERYGCGHCDTVGPNQYRPARKRRCWRCAHGVSQAWPGDEEGAC